MTRKKPMERYPLGPWPDDMWVGHLPLSCRPLRRLKWGDWETVGELRQLGNLQGELMRLRDIGKVSAREIIAVLERGNVPLESDTPPHCTRAAGQE
jgi:DNA-directed RNA polymerase alpha subunit